MVAGIDVVVMVVNVVAVDEGVDGEFVGQGDIDGSWSSEIAR